MAKITQIDLEGLSNEEIHNYYKTEDLYILPKKVREYILYDKKEDLNLVPELVKEHLDLFGQFARINRVKTLLNVIVLERFKAGEIK